MYLHIDAWGVSFNPQILSLSSLCDQHFGLGVKELLDTVFVVQFALFHVLQARTEDAF